MSLRIVIGCDDAGLQYKEILRRDLGLADQLAGFRGAAEAWFVLCGLCD